MGQRILLDIRERLPFSLFLFISPYAFLIPYESVEEGKTGIDYISFDILHD